SRSFRGAAKAASPEPMTLACDYGFRAPSPRSGPGTTAEGQRYASEFRQWKPSPPGDREAIVDQLIEGLLYVDVGGNDAGALQRQARGEDRLALPCLDLAVTQVRPLVELPVDHRVRQLGDRDKTLL